MLYIDIKYCNQLSNRLSRFKIKTHQPYLAVFRCPFCNDSQKDKKKTRGYIFEHKQNLIFKCHNCGESFYFNTFLQRLDPAVFEEYQRENILEKYGSLKQPEADFKTEEPIKFTPNLKNLKKVSQLEWDHPAKQYVLSRKIPNKFHTKLYFCPRFKKWVNSIIPSKFDSLEKDEPRLVIPLIDENLSIVGCCGRSFKKNSKLRYITIMFDPSAKKVFGLDEIDFNITSYILEGAIDSMFVNNAIAMVGADIASDYPSTYVFDNEPRNLEIVKRMEKVIKNGNKIFIWPTEIKQKDINELVLSGFDIDKINPLIDANTYYNLGAMVKFIEWKKR